MKNFLQSQEWADFQKSVGRKFWKTNGIFIIEYNLPIGKNYLYSSHFCLAERDSDGQARFENFLEEVRRIAKKENAIFFKIEPIDIDKNLLKKFKFRKSHNIQPQKTLILNITKTEKDLLKQMHQKTRYNLRLAEKKGVEIKKNKKYFEKFWELLKETAKKGKFRTHPKNYYRKILEMPGIELFIAKYKGRIIAANIVLFWEKTATYLHGASDYNYRNLMAPYLLQWQQILEAKKRGCVEYDFWGIDEKKWPGVTRFKKGFGGKEVNYPGAYDLIFQPIWYKIYKIARKIL